MPLSETRVIKHCSPFQQPDVNRIETIISTSLTKKHHWTKLALLRSSHNVPSRFSAYRQKKKLELSCHFATLPVLNISTRNPGRTSVAFGFSGAYFQSRHSVSIWSWEQGKGGNIHTTPCKLLFQMHGRNFLNIFSDGKEKTLGDQGIISCSVPGTAENSLQWKRRPRGAADVPSSTSLQQHRQSLLAAVSQRPRWL